MENFGSEIRNTAFYHVTFSEYCTDMTILLQVSGSGISDSAGEVREAESGAEQAAGRLQGRNGR
jgi:hypothetical protein